MRYNDDYKKLVQQIRDARKNRQPLPEPEPPSEGEDPQPVEIISPPDISSILPVYKDSGGAG